MARKKSIPSKPYDVAFKHLFEDRPRDALSWIGVTDVIEVQLLDTELSTTIAAADKVLRVKTSEGRFLVHFEFQYGHDTHLVRRLFWYNAALYHRHRLPVFTVVVLLTRAADSPKITGTLRVQ